MIAAARWGRVQCLRVLVAAGASLEAKNCAGFTALHAAVVLGNTDCVRYLVSVGADTEALTKVRPRFQ